MVDKSRNASAAGLAEYSESIFSVHEMLESQRFKQREKVNELKFQRDNFDHHTSNTTLGEINEDLQSAQMYLTFLNKELDSSTTALSEFSKASVSPVHDASQPLTMRQKAIDALSCLWSVASNCTLSIIFTAIALSVALPESVLYRLRDVEPKDYVGCLVLLIPLLSFALNKALKFRGIQLLSSAVIFVFMSVTLLGVSVFADDFSALCSAVTFLLVQMLLRAIPFGFVAYATHRKLIVKRDEKEPWMYRLDMN